MQIGRIQTMNNFTKYISNVLSLRQPQQESLEIFSQLMEILSLEKNPNLDDELAKVNEKFPKLTSFEREFPSICFSLATGIGKTRLMGACIAYLHYYKEIKNFFVMAPNLTIYNKLKADLGRPENPKYVFRGLDKFVNPPRIIDGDNYSNFNSSALFNSSSEIIINVFNISKLNSDSKTEDSKPARIKRLNEVLGESYFDYLKNLPDLCIFMDESHHYHADKSFEVINELQPILGVELTATPQIQKGAKKILFKNVVYEYSLANALNDEKFVKVPVVITRKDFRPDEYLPDQLDREKLIDGIKLHENTKNKLEIYARENDKQIVKPFVLIVAKDTAHSNKLLNYIKSKEFFGGRYTDKVIEVNSSLRGAEKDSNIELLLSLEKPDNKIEIVIHVNMLKEGWDVTNLYTIIPLRTSASETLTEQTIGRGLRLPYGERTGVEEVDRLSIVSHDRYEEIINLANNPNSLVRKVHYIEDEEIDDGMEEKEIIELQTNYDAFSQSESFTAQLALDIQQETEKSETSSRPQEANIKIANFVAARAAKSVIELNRQVKTFDAIKENDTQKLLVTSVVNETIQKFTDLNVNRNEIEKAVQKAVETCVQNLTENIIPIPRVVIQPSATIKQKFYKFQLNTQNIYWHPADDTLLGTELKTDGKTFELKSDIVESNSVDTIANEIVRHIIIHDNVDYAESADLLYSLVQEAKDFFMTYLSEDETNKIMRDRQKTLAEEIYKQMNEHFYHEEISFDSSKILPFVKIEPTFAGKIKSDEIYDLNANLQPVEVPRKIFQGFKKSCHSLYKFDSDTERTFARILEMDKDVLKWLRPASKQFDIYYNLRDSSRYEPDFVVETNNKIYMIETKKKSDLHTEEVKMKATAAKIWCETATNFNRKNGGKSWEYVLLPHDEIHLNSSFQHLVANRINIEQLHLY